MEINLYFFSFEPQMVQFLIFGFYLFFVEAGYGDGFERDCIFDGRRDYGRDYTPCFSNRGCIMIVVKYITSLNTIT